MQHIIGVALMLGFVGVGIGAGQSSRSQSLTLAVDAAQGAQQVSPAQAGQPAPGGVRVPNNIKLDLTITDTFGDTPTKKTVSMLSVNGESGMVRTSGHVGGAEVKLNVDAMVIRTFPTGEMHIRLTFEYKPAHAPTDQVARGLEPAGRGFPFELHESLNFIVQDGKPLLLSQSADPVSDRRVTVELTATVLK